MICTREDNLKHCLDNDGRDILPRINVNKNNDVKRHRYFCYLNITIEYPNLAEIVWLADRPNGSVFELRNMSASP